MPKGAPATGAVTEKGAQVCFSSSFSLIICEEFASSQEEAPSKAKRDVLYVYPETTASDSPENGNEQARDEYNEFAHNGRLPADRRGR